MKNIPLETDRTKYYPNIAFVDKGDFTTSNGCDLYSECESCPLPKCQFEESFYIQIGKIRDAGFAKLIYELGYDFTKIREAFPDIPPSTIFSAIKNIKKLVDSGVDIYEHFSIYRVKVSR